MSLEKRSQSLSSLLPNGRSKYWPPNGEPHAIASMVAGGLALPIAGSVCSRDTRLRLRSPYHPHIPIPPALSLHLLHCLGPRTRKLYLDLHGTSPEASRVFVVCFRLRRPILTVTFPILYLAQC